MKKKYIAPQSSIVAIQSQAMIAASPSELINEVGGGGQQSRFGETEWTLPEE